MFPSSKPLSINARDISNSPSSLSSSYSYSRMMTLARSLPKSEITPLLSSSSSTPLKPSGSRPNLNLNASSSKMTGSPMFVVDPTPSMPYTPYLKGLPSSLSEPSLPANRRAYQNCCRCCVPTANRLDLWCGKQSRRTRLFLLISTILMCTILFALITFTPTHIIYSSWSTQVCFFLFYFNLFF